MADEPKTKRRKIETASDEALFEQVEKFQDELFEIDQKSKEEIQKIEDAFQKKKVPLYKKRDQAIDKAGYWSKAWSSRLELSALVSLPEEEELWESLDKVRATKGSEETGSLTIALDFKDNSFISSNHLEKKYAADEAGAVKITFSEVKWKPGKQPKPQTEDGGDDSEEDEENEFLAIQKAGGFLNWFFAETDHEMEIADLIFQFYEDPLQPSVDIEEIDLDDEDDEE